MKLSGLTSEKSDRMLMKSIGFNFPGVHFGDRLTKLVRATNPALPARHG
jgi:hypothetical protein